MKKFPVRIYWASARLETYGIAVWIVQCSEPYHVVWLLGTYMYIVQLVLQDCSVQPATLWRPHMYVYSRGYVVHSVQCVTSNCLRGAFKFEFWQKLGIWTNWRILDNFKEILLVQMLIKHRNIYVIAVCKVLLCATVRDTYYCVQYTLYII